MLCPLCGREMVTGGSDPVRRSIDHILPKFRGGTKQIHGDTRNTRVMCAECNQFLSQCGQCLGAFVCATEVSAALGRNAWDVVREWGFGAINRVMVAADVARFKRECREAWAAALANEPRVTLGDLFAGRLTRPVKA